jgi:predicted acyl esterase
MEAVGWRLIVGPWTHGVGNEDMAFTEHLRWFDYTLKGINNKLDKEDPIYYATMFQTSTTDLGATWKSSTTWPLPDQVLTDFYFNDIHSGTVSSVNDGGLATVKPTGSGSPDVYYSRFKPGKSF